MNGLIIDNMQLLPVQQIQREKQSNYSKVAKFLLSFLKTEPKSVVSVMSHSTVAKEFKFPSWLDSIKLKIGKDNIK